MSKSRIAPDYEVCNCSINMIIFFPCIYSLSKIYNFFFCYEFLLLLLGHFSLTGNERTAVTATAVALVQCADCRRIGWIIQTYQKHSFMRILSSSSTITHPVIPKIFSLCFVVYLYYCLRFSSAGTSIWRGQKIISRYTSMQFAPLPSSPFYNLQHTECQYILLYF